MGGKRPFTLTDELPWIRARMAEQSDIRLRALLAELRDRGVDVSYFGVWHIAHHAWPSFEKAWTPASRIAQTSRAAEISGSDTKVALTRVT